MGEEVWRGVIKIGKVMIGRGYARNAIEMVGGWLREGECSSEKVIKMMPYMLQLMGSIVNKEGGDSKEGRMSIDIMLDALL